jgi:hypothetical protein
MITSGDLTDILYQRDAEITDADLDKLKLTSCVYRKPKSRRNGDEIHLWRLQWPRAYRLLSPRAQRDLGSESCRPYSIACHSANTSPRPRRVS